MEMSKTKLGAEHLNALASMANHLWTACVTGSGCGSTVSFHCTASKADRNSLLTFTAASSGP